MAVLIVECRSPRRLAGVEVAFGGAGPAAVGRSRWAVVAVGAAVADMRGRGGGGAAGEEGERGDVDLAGLEDKVRLRLQLLLL